MRQLMNHGQDRRYNHPMIGINGRLDTLQAAVLLSKLSIFEEEVDLRSRIGSRYSSKFATASKKIITPFIESHNTSVYAQYTIQVENRDALQQALQAAGVPTAVHYPIPLNLQPVFSALGKPEGSFPVSESVAKKVMSLPMHPYLEDSAMDRIVEAVAGQL
jgi:UDP-2-acetamido-2-deoxy-ribo-hexuluronate aminotransferase